MLHTIKNNYLSVTVSDQGAELQSIKSADGTEHLWQGDPAYWTDRSPTLFPYIGRMIGKQYSYLGKTYSMDIHGFAAAMKFDVVKHSDTEIVFRLKSTPETILQYPWVFAFSVGYALSNNRIDVTFTVENQDTTTMLFAVGGHPGFNVPFAKGESFEDYRLRFTEGCFPDRIIFTEDCFVDEKTEAFRLDENNAVSLSHSLFDNDAIVLKNTSKTVVLESTKSGRSIGVSFPQMEYIGFWHMPKTDAPYVCIEPWSSLPSARGTKTVWDAQEDLLQLAPSKIYQNKWSILVK